jgi:hypothetical protein
MRVVTLLAVGLVAFAAEASGPTLAVDLADVSTDAGVLLRVHGSVGDGSLGVPVAGGGDLDGDRFVDYAFASMRASPPGRPGAGIVYLVFGDGAIVGAIDTALPSPDLLVSRGETELETAGSELWMDDVTGDGLADLLIARQNHAPDLARPGAGALSILAGGSQVRAHAAGLTPLDLAEPPTGMTVTTLVGAAPVDRLGMWLRTGDVTGDGIPDIVVSADQEDGDGETDRGSVYVIRGGSHLAMTRKIDLAAFGTTALAGHLLRITPPLGSTEFHFGATCQIADLDGNGTAEVLASAALARGGGIIRAAGAPAGSAHGVVGSENGTLFIVWDDNFTGDPWPAGKTIDLDVPAGGLTVIDGGSLNVRFGEEIVGGDDYDDDGRADLFVGDIVGNLTGTLPNSGSGHVLYDAAQLKGLAFDMDAPSVGVVTTTFLGGAAGDIAADTAIRGDFDGDGTSDLAFSSPHASPLGRARAGSLHVFFGQRGPWPALIDLAPGALPDPSFVRSTVVYGAHGTVGTDIGDTLCYSAAGADVDGDGRGDLVANEMVGNGLGPDTEDVGNLVVLSGRLVSGPASLCGATPHASCRQPGRARLALLAGSDPELDRLSWMWQRGEETPLDALGSPLSSSTTYGLCLYDTSAAAQPRADVGVAGGAGWIAAGPNGFRYDSATGAPFGVRKIKIKAGTSGRPRIVVKGEGSALGLASLPLTFPVTVQLVVDDDTSFECWEANFSSAKRNEASRVTAVSP